MLRLVLHLVLRWVVLTLGGVETLVVLGLICLTVIDLLSTPDSYRMKIAGDLAVLVAFIIAPFLVPALVMAVRDRSLPLALVFTLIVAVTVSAMLGLFGVDLATSFALAHVEPAPIVAATSAA